MRLVLVVLAMLLLNGCALMNRPSPEQIAQADYGSFPTNYQATIKHYMDNVLKDPTSAMYSDWRGPSQGYVSNMHGAFFGYRVCVMVNAKNSYGGYTGKQPHTFVIKNDSIIQYKGGGVSGTIGLEESYKLCNLIPETPNNPGKFVIGYQSIFVTADGSPAKTSEDSVGAKIFDITANSRAEKSGLIVGDIITKIGSTDIRKHSDVNTSISKMQEGESAPIFVLRNSKHLELKLTY